MAPSTEAPPRDRSTAVAAKLPTRPRQTRSLSPGPLLAVCGLAGGVGATTVAYLVALTARRQWRRPVIVADTGGPTGGLCARAGVEVPRSLGALARDLATGLALGHGILATGTDGLGVLASRPEFATSCDPGALRQLLRDACEAHDLTVIDCGTLSRQADQTAAAAATHVAWVTTATRHGLDRARRVLEEARPPAGPELIVARRDARQSSVPIRDLRTFAAGRRAPLVLIPHLEGLDSGDVDRAYEAAQVSNQAILGALTRQLPKAAQ